MLHNLIASLSAENEEISLYVIVSVLVLARSEHEMTVDVQWLVEVDALATLVLDQVDVFEASNSILKVKILN